MIRTIGEKEDAAPKKPVRFIFAKFPRIKSSAPNAIRIYPIICMVKFNLKQMNHQDNSYCCLKHLYPN